MTEELNYDIEFELSGYSTEESLHAIREEWPALLAASEKSLPLCGSLSLSTVLIKQLSKRNVTPTEIVESIIKFLTDYRAELLITHTSMRESELGDTAAAALLAYLLSFEGSGQTLTELDLSSLGGITMAGHYAYGFGPKCRSVLLKSLRKYPLPNLQILCLSGCRLGREYVLFEERGHSPDFLPEEPDCAIELAAVLRALPKLCILKIEGCSLSPEEKALFKAMNSSHLTVQA